ncbi:MAG: alkaline phosphatase family protein, partial [Candidatus Cloacimonetes bacterium]|nr:alkaline phosphatase family protein [Candidatus Cloacimonadota bacterium]
CGVINLPLSHPAEWLEGGYMVGGMHTPQLNELSPHPVVQELLRGEFCDYVIDVMSYWYQDMREFVARVHAMETRRTDFVLRLRQEIPVDVLFVTWVGIDRICHAFMDQQEFLVGDYADWKYQGLVLDMYKHLDTQLGRVMEACGSTPLYMVLSDHGFGDLKKDVYLNNYLHERGWLKFKAHELSRSVLTHPNWNYGPLLSMFLKAMMHLPPVQRKLAWQQKHMEAVDWARTVAFSTGLFGNVFLNRCERFPEGFLDKNSDEYETLRRSIMDDLMLLCDGKQRIVDEIYLAEEIYFGPYVQKAPDLILKMCDYSYITRGGFEFRSNQIFDTPAINHSGNHRMLGIFILSGPMIGAFPQSEIESRLGRVVNLMDLVPTMMAYLNTPIPLDMDGTVLDFLFAQPINPRFLKLNIYRGHDSVATEVSEEVKQRLSSLGYLS